MFTGIVETMGTVKDVSPLDMTESGGAGFSMTITDAQIVLSDVHLGDSISVNGTCLTVTEFDNERSTFKVGISPETLRKTCLGSDYDIIHSVIALNQISSLKKRLLASRLLGDLKVGQKVNLERAMSASTRFGGHMVQGHVDTTVTIASISPDPPNSLLIKFHVSSPTSDSTSDFLSYIIPKGYVALDGTSLTVIDVDWTRREFSVMLIAYTQERVVLPLKTVGDRVNLEVDPMGKYVENIFKGMLNAEHSPLRKLMLESASRLH